MFGFTDGDRRGRRETQKSGGEEGGQHEGGSLERRKNSGAEGGWCGGRVAGEELADQPRGAGETVHGEGAAAATAEGEGGGNEG